MDISYPRRGGGTGIVLLLGILLEDEKSRRRHYFVKPIVFFSLSCPFSNHVEVVRDVTPSGWLIWVPDFLFSFSLLSIAVQLSIVDEDTWLLFNRSLFILFGKANGWRGHIILCLCGRIRYLSLFVFYDDEIFAVLGSTPFGTVYCEAVRERVYRPPGKNQSRLGDRNIRSIWWIPLLDNEISTRRVLFGPYKSSHTLVPLFLVWISSRFEYIDWLQVESRLKVVRARSLAPTAADWNGTGGRAHLGEGNRYIRLATGQTDDRESIELAVGDGIVRAQLAKRELWKKGKDKYDNNNDNNEERGKAALLINHGRLANPN